MKVVYITGPYRAATEYGVLCNIRRAEEAAVAVWRAGGAALCPHKNTAFLGGAVADSVWLAGDQEMLRRCDAVLCLAGWEDSEGASAKVQLAWSLGLPVFPHLDTLRAWLEAEQGVSAVFDTGAGQLVARD